MDGAEGAAGGDHRSGAPTACAIYHLGANWRRRVEHVGAKPAADLGGTLIV